MLGRCLTARTGFILARPKPVVPANGSYEDSEKCLSFLRDSTTAFHMLLYLNKYMKEKLKIFIRLAKEQAEPQVLWNEMHKFMVLMKEITIVDYCIDDGKDLMLEEMLQWICPLLDLLMTSTLPPAYESRNDPGGTVADESESKQSKPNANGEAINGLDDSFNDNKENIDTLNLPLVFEEAIVDFLPSKPDEDIDSEMMT